MEPITGLLALGFVLGVGRKAWVDKENRDGNPQAGREYDQQQQEKRESEREQRRIDDGTFQNFKRRK